MMFIEGNLNCDIRRINMNYSLVENSVDSLKAAYENINKFEESTQSQNPAHYIKDAVIFLNHGIEILLKSLISESSQALLFVDINKYLKAKEKMTKENKNDVFEVDESLRTITLEECINRTQYACDILIPKKFTAAIYYLLNKRNKLMHYALKLEREDYDVLLKTLKACYQEAITFFELHIQNFNSLFENARFIIKDLEQLDKEYQKLVSDIEWAIIENQQKAYDDYIADMGDALEETHS